MHKDQIRKYCKKIQKSIHCSKNAKIRFLHETMQAMEEYLLEHPGATDSDLENFFGAPEVIAEDFMQLLDADEVKQFHRKRQSFFKCLIALAVAGILVLGGLLFLVWNNSREPITVTTVIHEGVAYEEAKD